MENLGIKKFLSEWSLSGWLITIFVALSFIPQISTSIGDGLKKFLSPKDRIVIGVVDNKILSKSGMQQATKIKTPNGILIEILGQADEHGTRPLLDKVLIPDIEDAFYHLHSRATNLAITDVDGDGEPEIIAPTYDREGRPRLNAIKYNLETKRFLLVE